jgi:MFS transporter, DHA1 family, multidrug resistance protein
LRLTAIVDPLRQNEALALLCATQLAQMSSMGIITPILPLYANSFQVGAAMVGLVISSFGTARLLVNLPAGQLSERFGRRNMIIAGTMFTTAGVFLSGLAPTFELLVLFRFISGLGSGIFTTSAMIYITDITTPRNRGRSMSMYQGSVLVGGSIGPAVGGFVAEAFGFHAPFFVAGVFNLIAMVWTMLRIPDLRLSQYAQKAALQVGQTAKASVKSMLMNRNFLLVCFINSGLFLSRSGARLTIMPLLGHTQMNLSEAQLGLVFTAMAVLNLVTVPIAGIIADRFGRKAAIVPSTIVAAFAHVLMALSPSLGSGEPVGIAVFYFSAALIGLGTGIGGPTPATYAADVSPEGSRGLTLGLFRSSGDLAMVIGPVVLGWIAQMTSYSGALYFDAAYVLAGSLAFALLAQETLVRERVAARV